MSDRQATGRRGGPTNDLRLLGPRGAGLGGGRRRSRHLASRGHLVMAALAAVLGLVLALVPSRRWEIRWRWDARWRWPAILLAVLVVLLQVAAAGHSVLRDRGGVRALAAERASVAAVVVVTGDPVVLAGRGEQVEGAAGRHGGRRRRPWRPAQHRGHRCCSRATGPRRAGVAIDRRGPRPARSRRARRTTASRCCRSAGRRSSWKARGAWRPRPSACGPGSAGSVDHAPADARGLLPGWSSATPAAPRTTSPQRCAPPA